MKNFSLLLLLFITTLGFTQTEVVQTPQIAFKIGLGTTVSNDGVKIQFKEVLEDSRCPLNVQCVWAGQARVRVMVSGPDLPEESLDLIVAKKDKNVLFIAENYVLKAMGLAPYPDTKNPENKKYILSVVKEKL
ncbi:MAG: hypothetical protein AAF489_01050 [Bacteroidota bacterium]